MPEAEKTLRNQDFSESYLNACRVIVTGSRCFNDFGFLKQELDKLFNENEEFVGKEIKIISGVALGTDALAIDYADKHKLTKILFPANWKRYPLVAGFLRNEDMLSVATHLVAFWDGKSKGTESSINQARRLGKHVEIVKI